MNETTGDGEDWHEESKAQIRQLSTADAFGIYNHFDQMTSLVKGRAWTMTVWVLTLDAGLLAFAQTLYVDHRLLPGFMFLQFVIMLVGLALCGFTYVSLKDHANHLEYYWKIGNRVGGWHLASRGVVFLPDEEARIAAGDFTPTSPPKFIQRLTLLNWLFVGGFILNFVAIAGLHDWIGS